MFRKGEEGSLVLLAALGAMRSRRWKTDNGVEDEGSKGQ